MEANSYEGILSLIPGMYVRVPPDTERTDNNFREYRIGQLYSLDEVANTAIVRFHGYADEEQDEVECRLDYLDRCFILPDTACELAHDSLRGRILYRCSDDSLPGTFAEYYVHVERLNGALRDRLNALTRKTHAFAKRDATWDALVGLQLFDHNFHRAHQCSPAMALWLTDHLWSFQQLLTTRIPITP